MLKKMVFKYFCVGRQPFSSGTPPAVPSFSVFVNVDQDFWLLSLLVRITHYLLISWSFPFFWYFGREWDGKKDNQNENKICQQIFVLLIIWPIVMNRMATFWKGIMLLRKSGYDVQSWWQRPTQSLHFWIKTENEVCENFWELILWPFY